jgi:hypothetical protein
MEPDELKMLETALDEAKAELAASTLKWIG